MPDLNCSILRTRNNDGQFRVIAGKGDIASMALQCCDKRFGGVVPDLDCLIIAGGQQVWFIGSRVVVNMVDALGFVGLESRVGVGGTKAPNLDSSVKTGTCESAVYRLSR